MYLLDTNVLSMLDGRHREFARPLIGWMRRNTGVLHLSVITVIELETGVLKIERQGASERSIKLRLFVDAMLHVFAGRLLVVDLETAHTAARLGERALPTQSGAADLLIAATATVHGLTVLTRNIRHFRPTGVACLDPFDRLPPDA